MISASAPVVVPAGVEVVGLGALSTTIQAASGFTDSSVIQMGSNGQSAGPQFAVKIKGLTIDCNAQTLCTGILNNMSEEGSTVEDVIITNAATGLEVDLPTTPTSSTPAAANSGPYRNITITYPNTTCCSGAIGVLVKGGDCGQIVRGFDNISVNARGNSNSSSDTGIEILGASTRIADSTISYVGTGIQIGNTGTSGVACQSGSTASTHNVIVENVYLFNTSSNSIVAEQTSSDIFLTNISTNETNILDDMGVYSNNAYTPIKLPGGFLGFYMRGECCAMSGTSTLPSALATSAPQTTGSNTNLVWEAPAGYSGP